MSIDEAWLWFGVIGKTTSGEDVMRFVRIDGQEAS